MLVALFIIFICHIVLKKIKIFLILVDYINKLKKNKALKQRKIFSLCENLLITQV